jgi:hypothetical protein
VGNLVGACGSDELVDRDIEAVAEGLGNAAESEAILRWRVLGTPVATPDTGP